MHIKKHQLRLLFAIGLTCGSFVIGIVTGFFLFTASTNTPPVNTIPTPPIVTPPPPREVSFTAAGDIMLSRNVARHAEKSGKPGWIWDNIRSFLSSSDFVIGNLEWPTNGTEVYSYQKVMDFNALPHLIRELPSANFAAVSLANNHILDQGVAGITITQQLLSEIGVAGFGAGENASEAWKPHIIERNGIKIAFIGASYAAYNDNGQGIYAWVARMQDTQKLIASVQEAKARADFVVVMMHAGAEYSRTPTRLQKDFAHNAIDAGADIVFGAHSHWTQGVESYQGKYIFYSLGNFVFDQEFSPETKTGLAVSVSLQKEANTTNINTLYLHPILIENYGQPRLLDGEEKIKALQDIQQERDSLDVNLKNIVSKS